MGLADRDYTRTTRPGMAPLRGRWSMNAILIVVCCAVFALDLLLASLPSTRTAAQISEWAPANPGEMEKARKSGALENGIEVYTQPNANGLGLMFLYPRDLPSALVGQVDPIATAAYQVVSPLRKWMQFTTAEALIGYTPSGSMTGGELWRFVGYGFLHVSVVHLAFNMVGLLVFGPWVERRLGRRRYLAFFMFCVVIGALSFLLLNGLGLAWLEMTDKNFFFPGLLFNDPHTPLIGASAGVYGTILAAAWLHPDEEIMAMFVLPVRLRYFAIVLIIASVWTLLKNGQNAGGEAAHLGGGLAGWLIVQRPRLLEDFFDFFRFLDPVFDRLRGRRAAPAQPFRRTVTDEEVDRILIKAREKGLHGLSARERQALRTASDERRAQGPKAGG
ncbi:MAG: rhomboid family intramembrane serine protease [Planctomycetaceae bacterium]|nr:rhomboid family intramembrane serine protease [Planctomycetaceae bacterium]